MLLSEGNNQAWTYTDEKYYNEAARKHGEYLFHPSEDVANVQGRKFDYTLVLDGDTGVVKDSLHRLMNVAAANPNRAIVQPSIQMIAEPHNSLFMHIDAMRQEINEPISAALTTLLGRSGFFGKGLIQNRLYIKALLGRPEKPIEKVPIDVLSHDTFEAAALSPLYVKSVSLLEEPCGNYVTWDIRECRWNRGELVLSHYFFPDSMGAFFTWLMTKIRDKPPVELHLRTETHLDEAGAYIAHSALRQMILKPMLLLYILGQAGLKSYAYYPMAPLIIVMFGVLVLPKFAIMRRDNVHLVIAESICSILQFSPEVCKECVAFSFLSLDSFHLLIHFFSYPQPIMGTLRTFNSIKAHVSGVSGWVPQFKVEQDFVIKPAIVATLQYQWKMILSMAAPLVVLYIFKPKDIMMRTLLEFTIALPVYTTVTALTYEFWERQATVWVVGPATTAQRVTVAVLQSVRARVNHLDRSVRQQMEAVLRNLAMEKYQQPPPPLPSIRPRDSLNHIDRSIREQMDAVFRSLAMEKYQPLPLQPDPREKCSSTTKSPLNDKESIREQMDAVFPRLAMEKYQPLPLQPDPREQCSSTTNSPLNDKEGDNSSMDQEQDQAIGAPPTLSHSKHTSSQKSLTPAPIVAAKDDEATTNNKTLEMDCSRMRLCRTPPKSQTIVSSAA
jgi:hypothetical protein